MTHETKTKYRWVKEATDNAVEELRFKLDLLIDSLNGSIDNIKEVDCEDLQDSTEKISFINYRSDSIHKLQEYVSLLTQIMEKTL